VTLWRIARFIVYWLYNVHVKKKVSQKKILKLPTDDSIGTKPESHKTNVSVWEKIDKERGVKYPEGFDPKAMEEAINKHKQSK